MTLQKPQHIRETKSKIWISAIMPLGKTYPVFRFGKVFSFRENTFNIHTPSFDNHGDPWIHIIVGPEKAMLIDTGFGIGDLKGLVTQLIGDMPLIVVNTHPHIDHCYGNCQFDKVYCHKYAVPVLERQSKDMWDHLFDENGKGVCVESDISEVVPFRQYEIVGCENNTVFNLGGDYDVELIFMPGHDPAHCCFLDKKSRILYGGDTLLYIAGMGHNTKKDFAKEPYGEYATVEAMRDELEKLVKRMDEFDVIFMSHMVLGEDKQLVLDIFNAAEAVIEDPDCNEYINTMPNGLVNKVKVWGDLASVEYCDERIYKKTILDRRAAMALE